MNIKNMDKSVALNKEYKKLKKILDALHEMQDDPKLKVRDMLIIKNDASGLVAVLPQMSEDVLQAVLGVVNERHVTVIKQIEKL